MAVEGRIDNLSVRQQNLERHHLAGQAIFDSVPFLHAMQECIAEESASQEENFGTPIQKLASASFPCAGGMHMFFARHILCSVFAKGRY